MTAPPRHVILLVICGFLSASAQAEGPDALLESLKSQLPACAGVDASQALPLLSARLASADPEIRKGMSAILQDEAWRVGERERENPALSLRAALALSDAPPVKGCIDEALALANSWLWSVADATLREEIISDCVAHRTLFREIMDHQERNGVPFGLAALPLVPAVFWADRIGPSYWELSASLATSPGGLIKHSFYREFVDSIDSLRAVRSAVMERKIWMGSPRERAREAEDFVHSARDYRSSMENLADFKARGIFGDKDLAQARQEYAAGLYETEHMGKRRRWDGFNWLNWQVDLFRRTGRFRGDCGTTTTVQMAFFRMAGIAPISLQWIDPAGVAAFTHNCPGWYHAGMGRWFAIQRPVLVEAGGVPVERVAPCFIHYTKPPWHPWRVAEDFKRVDLPGAPGAISSSLYPGELSDTWKIVGMLDLGIPGVLLEEGFFRMPDGLKPGSLIPAAVGRGRLIDSDWDGLVDALEKETGTDPENPDSDGDGRSDAWELDRGFPARKKNPSPAGSPSVDGLVTMDEYGSGAWSSDSAGDIKGSDPAKDISSFGCLIEDGNLFCSAAFSSPAASGKPPIHSIHIWARGKALEKYWFQWVGDYCQAYRIQGEDGSVFSPLGSAGMRSMVGRDAEFSIPLSFMPDAASYLVRYYASGRFGGADQVADDMSAVLRPPFPSDAFLKEAKAVLAGKKALIDPAGDCKALRNAHDLLSLSMARAKDGDCFIRAGFADEPLEPSMGLMTIHVRDEEGGMNWWIQWWSLAEMALWTWKDGEEGKNQAVDPLDWDCAAEGRDLFLLIPGSVVGRAVKRTIIFHSGVIHADGSIDTDADLGEPLVLSGD